MTAWYNEPDPYAAQRLENLIAAGHIAPGVVDRRPIQEIEAWELTNFTQCHFFAGIGVWSYALRSVGWLDDRPIWTGSCPCQPFSAAGKKKGFSDDRHLWPYWFDLIAQREPAIVVGEQVDKALDWLDLVSTDLERADYAFGAAILPAAGYSGAHIRHRTYFVGLANASHQQQHRSGNAGASGRVEYPIGSSVERLALSDSRQRIGIAEGEGCERNGATSGWLESDSSTQSSGAAGGLGDADDAGLERRLGVSECGNQCAAGSASLVGGLEHSNVASQYGRASSREHPLRDVDPRGDAERPVLHSREIGSFDDADWLLCRNPTGEPSWRPVEPGTFPLAHGIADRVGRLRTYSNALDAETATNFCIVVREIVEGI